MIAPNGKTGTLYCSLGEGVISGKVTYQGA